MSTFSGIFKMNVKQQFQYRTAAFSGIITQLFFGFMQIALFKAFLSTGQTDFTVSQMMSYICKSIWFAHRSTKNIRKK